ncbi:MAG: ABC transporter permease, partial [Lentisphaerae bacterium]
MLTRIRLFLLVTWMTARKELLILWRDRTGLLVIFLMPLILSVLMAFLQNRMMESSNLDNLNMIVLDDDASETSKRLIQALKEQCGIDVEITMANSATLSRRQLIKTVIAGHYRVGLMIPRDFASTLRKRIDAQCQHMLGMDSGPEPTVKSKAETIEVVFDPILHGSFRKAFSLGLNQALQFVSLKLQTDRLNQLIQTKLKRQIRLQIEKQLGEPLTDEDAARFLALFDRIDLDPQTSAPAPSIQFSVEAPTALQHNIPAWALFGMFFIVVPFAGALVREKNSGTWERIQTFATSVWGIFCGRITAAIVICSAQFSLILATGYGLLPRLGLAPLPLGTHAWLLLPVTLVVSIAAGAYSTVVGAWAKTFEQASMFGAISVVIAAATGGIMVPVYLMPTLFQKLSLLSPLAWALNAYYAVFVRNLPPGAIGKELLMLVLFSLACIILSW